LSQEARANNVASAHYRFPSRYENFVLLCVLRRPIWRIVPVAFEQPQSVFGLPLPLIGPKQSILSVTFGALMRLGAFVSVICENTVNDKQGYCDKNDPKRGVRHH
jgi:hypothetical protein